MTDCSGGLVPDVAALIGACKSMAEFNLAIDPATGYPTTEACLSNAFSFYYPTPDVSSAFQSLYTNPSIRSSFLGYWTVLAQRFRNNPYILGYDLFNEPWAGNLWKDLLLLDPGFADLHVLQELYQDLHTAIRKDGSDQNHIIFFE